MTKPFIDHLYLELKGQTSPALYNAGQAAITVRCLIAFR